MKSAAAGGHLQRAYDRIDNSVYDGENDPWWQPDSVLYLLKTSVNPVRVGFFKRKLFKELYISPQGCAALEVGCGGGILCEEIARLGFSTTGIDPSANSLHFANEHAKSGGLAIGYVEGVGEALPFRDASYDVVFCCDVLEHVNDLPRVISEICRVLKPGGVFCYDTINRTLISKLIAINVTQRWKRWAFMPPNLHVWEMFIRPDEIKSLLHKNNFDWKEHRGTAPNVSYAKMMHYLRKRAKGEWTYQDLSEKLLLVESKNMSIMYMGYAIKKL